MRKEAYFLFIFLLGFIFSINSAFAEYSDSNVIINLENNPDLLNNLLSQCGEQDCQIINSDSSIEGEIYFDEDYSEGENTVSEELNENEIFDGYIVEFDSKKRDRKIH